MRQMQPMCQTREKSAVSRPHLALSIVLSRCPCWHPHGPPASCFACAHPTPAMHRTLVQRSCINFHPATVQQAASAIAAQLANSGSGKGRGFGDGAGGRKLSVDVPVLESGAAAAVQLAQDIIAALPKQLAKQFTIVSCADGGAAPAARSGGAPVLGLQQALGGADLGGCLLIAAPSAGQVGAACSAAGRPGPANCGGALPCCCGIFC